MLRALEISNVVLIEHLSLEFDEGLVALTGETGAGKSILLDSLGFALGRKGRAQMVRQGAERGVVVAAFDIGPNHPALAILADADIDIDTDEGVLILRRQVQASGRSSGFVNDRRVSTDILRAVGETLVEVHGQHDDRGLLNPRGHRGILDAYLGKADALLKLREKWNARQQAEALLESEKAALAVAAADAEWLAHAVEELERLAAEEHEDEKLDAERRLMQGAERIREDVAKAAQAISGAGAEGAMADAIRWLDGAADKAEGRLDAPIAALGRAYEELSDAQRGVEDALDALQFDPLALEQIEERLFAIRGMARKHNCLPDQLPLLTQQLRARLDALEAGDGRVAELEAALKAAASAYDDAAMAISAQRKKAASRLDSRVAAELAPLKMERAVFSTWIEPETAGPDGIDRVEFTVATNPGAPAGPLGKIASGGELSRFLLALKVCLAESGEERALIFDEIDRGVGGATADAVGRRLARLAQTAQVLTVTHSPQVAARASHHFHIAKSSDGEVTRTDVVRIADTDRADEIARMLAGETVTDAAREAARALLAD